MNALDLAHCDAWSLFPSIWKHLYYFPVGVSVDDHDVVVVDIVSLK